MNLLIKILIFVLSASPMWAQTTSDQLVQAALQNHPLNRAAAFDVQAKKYAEKAALNLPNPEINAESPTGEFYAVGVLQSFEFPTVYIRQKQVAKAETALAQTAQAVNENELRYTIRSLYLEAQVAEYQARQWAERDSVYIRLAGTAARQFSGGEIDFLQKTLADNDAGTVHQERLAAEQNVYLFRQQLQSLTGIADLSVLSPLVADTVGLFGQTLQGNVTGNPSIAYEQQSARVAEQEVQLAKSRALPNFSLGYLNQGPRNTPLDYRFRASIGIPLWAGQYRAGVKSAEAESQAAIARAEAQSQTIALERERYQREAATKLGLLHYYEREALPRSQVLISTALRLREVGQTDYLTFLRTLDEAYGIKREYATQVQAFETARITLLYLSGR
ncbi:MAG TPA: TolC family protein [Saprospiraceae bacterium]|nr:TolC family protein [Saprospiraceae bacterium]HPI04802.1 TolC family protein [Saprospiraceae bacterium]